MRINTALLLLPILISTGFGFVLEPQLKKSTDRAVDLLINCAFEQALVVTDSMMAADTVEPLYSYLHLCALGLRDLDFDCVIDTNAFLQSYYKTIRKIVDYEKLHGKDSYSTTIKGFTYAVHSSFYLMHKKYFSAIGTGLDAVDLFNKAKEMDSANYDAEFFLGFYNYAKGELKKRLWMVLFWYPGSKKEGLLSLERCGKYSQLVAEASNLILVDVYCKEERYAEAKKIADRLMPKYPNSRFLLWSMARYYHALKNFPKASAMYGTLADSYGRDRYGVYNSLVTRRLQLATLSRSGNAQAASKLARSVLDGQMCSTDERTEKLCKELIRFVKE